MWVFPREDSLTDRYMFEMVDSCEFLKLEKYSSGISSVFFSTLSLLSSSGAEERQDNWRIRINLDTREKSGATRVLAVSTTEEGIMKKWTFLTNLKFELGAMDNLEDQVKYFLDKVTSLAQIQEGGGEEEAVIQKFKLRFPQLANEKFIKGNSNCWWWCKGRVMPFEGSLYLTEASIVFYETNNNYEKIIPISKIAQYSKDQTGLFQESLLIVVKTEKEKIELNFDLHDIPSLNSTPRTNTNSSPLASARSSAAVEIVEEVFWIATDNTDLLYDTVDSIWRDILHQWQLKLEPELGNVSNASFSKSYAQIQDEYEKSSFSREFAIPDSFLIGHDYKVLLWIGKRYRLGKLYLTENFMCFKTLEEVEFTKNFKLVIAWVNVLDIQPEGILWQMLNSAIKIKTLTNEFLVCTPPGLLSRDELLGKMNQFRSERLEYQKRKDDETGARVPNEKESQGYLMEPSLIDKDYLDSEAAIAAKWDKYFKKYSKLMEPLVCDELEILLINGIPDCYRGKLWQFLTGSCQKMYANPGYYQDILKCKIGASSGERELRAKDDIERDLNRILPRHPFYLDGHGIDKLRNVLVAYSRRGTHIGYCQAMGVVAGTLLLYMNEEEAFWLLSCICEEIVPDYYSEGLELMGSIIDMKIFVQITKNNLPKLDAHLTDLGIPIETIVLPWFLCFFLGYIPWRLSMRVLDLMFSFGTNILFQVGLAVLTIAEKKLITMKSIEDLSEIIRNVVSEEHTQDLVHMALANIESLGSENTITELRKKYKFEMMNEIQHEKDSGKKVSRF